MSAVICIKGLEKWFGRTKALQGLDMEVLEGDIYGFLGPNGAGKTTTLRILGTLLRPDRGKATVLGLDVVSQARKVRPLIGYMPDSCGAYRDMLVSEYLEFFAAAYRVPPSERERVVADCVELTGLSDKSGELIEGLSRGMRQRLGLARCLIHDPQVLLLDEPASGLDPRARIEVIEILKTLGAMGKTILISSHILSELRLLCNRIGIVDHGTLIYAGTITDALERARGAFRLEVRLVDRAEEAARTLEQLDAVTEVSATENIVLAELAEGAADHSFIADTLVGKGFKVLTIREQEVMLEDAFIKLTDREGPPEAQRSA
jgi:ABC-2 type transport system ATP-binding protein